MLAKLTCWLAKSNVAGEVIKKIRFPSIFRWHVPPLTIFPGAASVDQSGRWGRYGGGGRGGEVYLWMHFGRCHVHVHWNSTYTIDWYMCVCVFIIRHYNYLYVYIYIPLFIFIYRLIDIYTCWTVVVYCLCIWGCVTTLSLHLEMEMDG